MATAMYDCNNIVEYDENGNVDLSGSVLACSNALPGPLSPVSYTKNADGERRNLTLMSQYNLNNLVEVDEIEGVAEVNFYWRITWYDERWNMTAMWSALKDPTISQLGFEIYSMTEDENDMLRLWVPDLMFEQLVDLNIFANTMKIFPNGKLYWSRLVTVRLAQPGFDYSDYPMDSQGIVISTMSYGLASVHLTQILADPPVDYNKDANGYTFKQHPIWKTKIGDFDSMVYQRDLALDPKVKRIYDVSVVSLNMDRDGSGVIVRFSLPILILLVLAGITFWAEIESRIDTTMTVLLSVSALYVVIIGNIPLLGYLTLFDRWILYMFLLLTACVCLHQFIGRIIMKKGDWPFRNPSVRVLEVIGRVGLIPAILTMFYVAFTSDTNDEWIEPLLFTSIPVFIMIAIREVTGLAKDIRSAVAEVRGKLDDPLHSTTSPFELFWYNLFAFGTLSTSRARHKQAMLARRRLANVTEGVNRSPIAADPIEITPRGGDMRHRSNHTTSSSKKQGDFHEEDPTDGGL